jgi:hypothetical protein
MGASLYPVLEHPIEGFNVRTVSGKALARVVELHPALMDLLDFYSADPAEIASELGMISPHDPEDADDLNELDLGPEEWFEPTAGLVTVRQAREALVADPGSLAVTVYDPRLRPADVIADLEAIERVLLQAHQHETRFHFSMTT